MPLEICRDVSDMPARMAAADLAVIGGGTTSWEAAFLGLPTAAIVLADNQRANVEELARRGVTDNLGWHDSLTTAQMENRLASLLASPDERARMSQLGRELVDGWGGQRVAWEMVPRFRLRQAEQDDCRLVFDWSNDPEVRAASFSSDPICWPEHVSWFEQWLSDSRCEFYIIEDNEQPVGQVRFRVDAAGTAVLSISIDSRNRGRGLAAEILAKGTAQVLRRQDVACVRAFTKEDNGAMAKILPQAGYKFERNCTIQGQSARAYVRHRLPGEISG